MPLTLNVGLSRKVGRANYGSHGASVNFEVELEHSLIQRLDELKKANYLVAQVPLPSQRAQSFAAVNQRSS